MRAFVALLLAAGAVLAVLTLSAPTTTPAPAPAVSATFSGHHGPVLAGDAVTPKASSSCWTEHHDAEDGGDEQGVRASLHHADRCDADERPSCLTHYRPTLGGPQ